MSSPRSGEIRTSNICYRLRDGPCGRFVEVFLEYASDVFRLPTELPARFKTRSIKRAPCIFEIASEWKQSLRKKETFQDGVWIVESDTIPKGGLPDLGIPYVATYFDTRICADIPWTFLSGLANVSMSNSPVVLYHGTAKENTKQILKEGLKPSFGMFGTCVYLGTFWKAYRFAALSQTYVPRLGSIFRCLVFLKRPVLRSLYTEPTCHCPTCKGSVTFSDHLETWTAFGDHVYLFPVKLNDTYVVKNMEVALKDTSKLILDTVCFVKEGPTPYDPCDRSVRLL
jgi:hypothetical protein